MNKKVILVLLATLFAIPMEGFASEVGELQPIGTIGKGQRVLKGGKEALLFEHQGAGCLTHFWFGGNFKGVENTRIRYYVDGEEIPSIDMDLYMGHGIGFNDNQAPWATKHIGKVGRQNRLSKNHRNPVGETHPGDGPARQGCGGRSPDLVDHPWGGERAGPPRWGGIAGECEAQADPA